MQVALALQYFPPDGTSGPITVHTTIDGDLIREFRDTALAAAEDRCAALDGDDVACAIELAEVSRLRTVFDLLIPAELD